VSESHTPDRLVAVPERLVGGGHVAGLSPRLESAEPSDGRLVANVARMTPGRGRCAEAEANARRLAARWHAAQGVPTEALEKLSASGWLVEHWQECLAAAAPAPAAGASRSSSAAGRPPPGSCPRRRGSRPRG
jgi:hypothetical protein